MIQAVFKMRTRPEKRKEMLQTAQALKNLAKKEHGCLEYQVYQDPEDEDTIVFVGEWKSHRYLRDHVNSEGFGVLVGANRILAGDSVIYLNTISRKEVFNDFAALGNT
ncbi:MAG: antibiotic biosynthesis monooxygenase [Deltaproteobacteria bacterium]